MRAYRPYKIWDLSIYSRVYNLGALRSYIDENFTYLRHAQCYYATDCCFKAQKYVLYSDLNPLLSKCCLVKLSVIINYCNMVWIFLAAHRAHNVHVYKNVAGRLVYGVSPFIAPFDWKLEVIWLWTYIFFANILAAFPLKSFYSCSIRCTF